MHGHGGGGHFGGHIGGGHIGFGHLFGGGHHHFEGHSIGWGHPWGHGIGHWGGGCGCFGTNFFSIGLAPRFGRSFSRWRMVNPYLGTRIATGIVGASLAITAASAIANPNSLMIVRGPQGYYIGTESDPSPCANGNHVVVNLPHLVEFIVTDPAGNRYPVYSNSYCSVCGMHFLIHRSDIDQLTYACSPQTTSNTTTSALSSQDQMFYSPEQQQITSTSGQNTFSYSYSQPQVLQQQQQQQQQMSYMGPDVPKGYPDQY